MARAMTRVYLGLGSNVGDRRENLRAALHRLRERCAVTAVSSLYGSPAMVPEGADPGPDYLNAACAVETEIDPHELLAFAKSIERELGRRPSERWAPRPLDIDILLYGDTVISSPELVVPHPGIASRNFVLAPLAEIGAVAVHPLEGRTIGAMAEDVEYAGLEHVEGPEWSEA
jgi:2-amino-4-hydroxy-6-hydroxymethyldihydropteridine diphosphokinase